MISSSFDDINQHSLTAKINLLYFYEKTNLSSTENIRNLWMKEITKRQAIYFQGLGNYYEKLHLIKFNLYLIGFSKFIIQPSTMRMVDTIPFKMQAMIHDANSWCKVVVSNVCRLSQFRISLNILYWYHFILSLLFKLTKQISLIRDWVLRSEFIHVVIGSKDATIHSYLLNAEMPIRPVLSCSESIDTEQMASNLIKTHASGLSRTLIYYAARL